MHVRAAPRVQHLTHVDSAAGLARMYGCWQVATGVTPAGCEGGDAGVLMQQLRQLLEELPGVAGPHSVTLGGCRATSHQGSAAAAYSYALRVTACANSQADALLRKGELSCADLAWTSSDGGSQQLCSANNTVVAVRKMARPPPSLTGAGPAVRCTTTFQQPRA